MIQEFLTNNLIQITEDENVEKLIKSSSLLEKKLLKSKQRISTFTLIALDPEIPASDSNVMEVQELIVKNWRTFIVNNKDTAITLIRAVIFEALKNLSKDINIANQIWLTGRDIQKYFNLIGKEKDLLFGFFMNLGTDIEKHAFSNWTLSTESKLEKLTLEIQKISGVTIDQTEIENHFKAASIHTSWGNGGESNFTSNTGNVNWALFFSQRVAKGISETFNDTFKKQSLQLNKNQAHIEERMNELIQQVLSEITIMNGSLNMRTQLLWWKEACYSSSLKNSYKEQQNGLLQIIMAYDYASYLPFINPISVDYFLKETHANLIENTGKVKLSEIMRLIGESKESLKHIFSDLTLEEGRISLLSFINGYVFGKYSLEHFKCCVGIPITTEISYSDFTIWMFHELKVLNALNNK